MERKSTAGIVPKLQNENNFGPNGIVNCKINVIPISEIVEVNDVKENNCNVFYVGNFPGTLPNGFGDFETTTLSDSTLSAIYNWSIECSRNLAIIPQAEAKLWGYTIENANTNPNSPVAGSNPFFSIFDGPFGEVQSFDQGGTFQGVITNFPSTGHTILSLDAMGLPTIALDFISSDLIIGDVGYFSVPNLGDITDGNEVFKQFLKISKTKSNLQLVKTAHFVKVDCDGENCTLIRVGGNIKHKAFVEDIGTPSINIDIENDSQDRIGNMIKELFLESEMTKDIIPIA